MGRMQILDYGRFFAALSVVFYHYLFNGINNGKISSISYIPEAVDFVKYGYLGVEFFFMISGYVIFISAKNRNASQFVVSRAVRLYPAFWVAVIFTSIFSIFWGGEEMSVTLSSFFANLTMVAPYLGESYVDGVYWTLMFELKFYFLVFILLFLGAQKQLDYIFLLWPFLIAVAAYFDKGYTIYLGSYFCYFSAGAILAMMSTSEKKIYLYLPSLLMAFYLCVSFSTGHAVGHSKATGVPYSEWVIGVVVTTFFLFFIINSKVGSNLKLYGSKTLGALTYPVYLIHAHFGYMFISNFSNEENKYLIYVLTIAIVISVAYTIHVFVEKRHASHWRDSFHFMIGRPVYLMNLKYDYALAIFKNRIK